MYIGIICNWKGLKEENYLYTLDEMADIDFPLLQACINDPDDLHSGWEFASANKTYDGILLRNDNEVRDFLSGEFNTDIEAMKAINLDTDYSDWYWENVENNDLFGKPSSTLKNVMDRLQIRTGV